MFGSYSKTKSLEHIYMQYRIIILLILLNIVGIRSGYFPLYTLRITLKLRLKVRKLPRHIELLRHYDWPRRPKVGHARPEPCRAVSFSSPLRYGFLIA
uniref:Uncharacterized protein n=1 Tax=mine drainage metagenome TaxID=410659 RepID=E6PZ43_9ZZZZ